MSHLTSKYKSTPTFSFKSKYQTVTSSNRHEHFPSPFDYDSSKQVMGTKSKPLGKFGKSSKFISHNLSSEKQPGPGTYQSSSSLKDSSFHKGEILTRGQKRFFESPYKNPGPDNYLPNQKNSTSSLKYSFTKDKKSRSNASVSQNNPPPDLYNPNYQVREKKLYFSIGKSLRKQNLLPTQSPGPGEYLEETGFQLSKSFNQKSQIFPRASRMKSSVSLDHFPSPSSYNVQSFTQRNQRKEKGFTCRSRLSIKLMANPAPNAYNSENLSIQNSRAKIAFAKSERTFLTKQMKRSLQTPGPGSHEINQSDRFRYRSASANKFSKSRLSFQTNSNLPNKIAFINPQKLDFSKTSMPKFSIPLSKARQATKQAVVDKFYDINLSKVTKTQQGFQIGKSNRMNPIIPRTVGPNHYNIKEETTFSRKIKFSKEQRKTFLDEAISSKLKLFKGETFQRRQQFPNPPKYMNVYKKIEINDSKLKRY